MATLVLVGCSRFQECKARAQDPSYAAWTILCLRERGWRDNASELEAKVSHRAGAPYLVIPGPELDEPLQGGLVGQREESLEDLHVMITPLGGKALPLFAHGREERVELPCALLHALLCGGLRKRVRVSARVRVRPRARVQRAGGGEGSPKRRLPQSQHPPAT